MIDFEKKFRSCGKVTSLTLSVNAISPQNLAHRRFFNSDVSQAKYAAFFFLNRWSKKGKYHQLFSEIK